MLFYAMVFCYLVRVWEKYVIVCCKLLLLYLLYDYSYYYYYISFQECYFALYIVHVCYVYDVKCEPYVMFDCYSWGGGGLNSVSLCLSMMQLFVLGRDIKQ